jgi:hypothetical protein
MMLAPTQQEVESSALQAQVSYGRLSWWQRMVLSSVAGDYVKDANRALDLAAPRSATRKVGAVTRYVGPRLGVPPRH